MHEREVTNNPEWVTRGRAITELIKELQTFENQDLEVKISTDDGLTFKKISLLGKHQEGDSFFCGLVNCE